MARRIRLRPPLRCALPAPTVIEHLGDRIGLLDADMAYQGMRCWHGVGLVANLLAVTGEEIRAGVFDAEAACDREGHARDLELRCAKLARKLSGIIAGPLRAPKRVARDELQAMLARRPGANADDAERAPVIPAWAGRCRTVTRAASRAPTIAGAAGARAVLQAECGLVLPDHLNAYTSSNDGDSVVSAAVSGLRDGWRRAGFPREGGLLILRIAARPWHCAVMVNACMFLHWPPVSTKGVQQLSCIERLNSIPWTRRIDGFWRHAATQA